MPMATIIGFFTAWPVSTWLIRRGIKGGHAGAGGILAASLLARPSVGIG